MFYPFVRLLLILLLKPLFRYEIQGSENIPAKGPVILAANHKSYLDPILLAIVSKKREINFMAKESLFKYPIFGATIKTLNAFPVKRGVGDKGAIVKALNLLRNNEVLVIFPEGTRYRKAGLGPAYPGVASIASKTGALIVPVGIIGTEKVLPEGSKIIRFPKIKINVGEPINPVLFIEERTKQIKGENQESKLSLAEKKEIEDELTKHMMNQISKLMINGNYAIDQNHSVEQVKNPSKNKDKNQNETQNQNHAGEQLEVR